MQECWKVAVGRILIVFMILPVTELLEIYGH